MTFRRGKRLCFLCLFWRDVTFASVSKVELYIWSRNQLLSRSDGAEFVAANSTVIDVASKFGLKIWAFSSLWKKAKWNVPVKNNGKQAIQRRSSLKQWLLGHRRWKRESREGKGHLGPRAFGAAAKLWRRSSEATGRNKWCNLSNKEAARMSWVCACSLSECVEALLNSTHMITRPPL